MLGIPKNPEIMAYPMYFKDKEPLHSCSAGFEEVQASISLKDFTADIEDRFPGMFEVKYASHGADNARHRLILWRSHVQKTI